MKHLFYVHSHIVNLVAKQMIKEERIMPEDCFFLLSRNYKSDFKNAIKLPYTHYPIDSFGVQILFWKNWTRLEELNLWIERITGGNSFMFYVPQSGFNFFYLMVNHPKCQGYAYLEEGLCSYLTEDKLRSNKKYFWLRDRWYDLNFKKKAPSVKHFYDLDHRKYKGAYGISENSFPNLPRKKVLGLPFIKSKEKSVYKHIVVLGQYVEYGEMKQETLVEAMRYFCSWLIHKKITSVHVKFHPVQRDKDSILPLRSLFKSFLPDLEFVEMGPNAVLENIAISTDANFYIVSSSVGIYAGIGGNKVYCLAKKVVDLEPKFQEKIDSFPEFFKEKLIYI